MKKVFSCLLAALLLALYCVGCGQTQELPDTYIEGSDYAYMRVGSFQFYPRIARGDKGYYVIHENYIYFLDEAMDTLLPLCNKVDCLHDRESDPEKRLYCNACILRPDSEHTRQLGLTYYDGCLYCMDNGDVGMPSSLYKISDEGAAKDLIYQWDDTSFVDWWLIHRGIFYWVERSYTVESDGVREQYTLYRVPLNHNMREKETIFVPDEDMDVVGLYHLQAYGNYLYFQYDRFATAEEGEITNDNYIDYRFLTTYAYDIVNKELHELTLPDIKKGEIIQGVTFWQDKILFVPYDLTADPMEPSTCYIANLDSSDVEVFMEDVPQIYMFMSDREYLYITNANAVLMKKDDSETFYQVYNDRAELIDTFTLSFDFSGTLPIGTDTMYAPYSGDDEEWGLYRWDKSGIGSYNGKAFEVTKISR